MFAFCKDAALKKAEPLTPAARVFSTSVAVLLLSLQPLYLDAATYYVDSVAGQDSNSGTSAQNALRSVSGAGSLSLGPGDIILFRRGQVFDGVFDLTANGNQAEPITIGAYDTGDDPILFEIRLEGSYLTIESIVVDHQKASADAVRLRNCHFCSITNVVVRNGTRDGIDIDGSSNISIEGVEIHHFLNGTFGSEDDAHGIVATDTDGLTIRDANIHHVSGDSFQTDPNRGPGSISNDILISDSVFWTSPLESDFNSGWQTGDSPGENAIDTKVLKTGYESEPRLRITIRNLVAYGWTAIPELGNRAVFNLKEKITADLDGISVSNSEIAFRVRGSLGNANTTVKNAVIFDVNTAVRAEDNLQNLRIYNSTFGALIDNHLSFAGGSGGVGTWDWRNNAFLNSKPSVASQEDNIVASSSDFVSIATNDYHLSSGSILLDKGTTLSEVPTDREGQPRTSPYDVGAYEGLGSTVSRPNPPVLVD